MSTREHRSGRQLEGDPSQGQHCMSQGSTVIEDDNTPTIQGPNPTDDVSLLDQTITTSVTDVEPSTILVPSIPPMPTFTTVKPKQEKLKGTVCVAASAKLNNRALTYIKNANENIVMLQNGIHTERSYSDGLLAEGKNHISSMQKTIKIFHGKIEGGLKNLAKAEKKLTETKAKHKYAIESLKLEVASLKKELSKSNTERDMYKAKADKAMQVKVVEKPAPNKPSQIELAREKSRLRIEEKRALMSHNSKIKKDEMEHNHNIRKKRLSTISGGIFSVDNSGAFCRKGKKSKKHKKTSHRRRHYSSSSSSSSSSDSNSDMSTPPRHKRKHHRSKDHAKKSKRVKKQHHSKHRRHDMETDVSDGKLSVIDYGTTPTRKSNSQFEIGSGDIRNTPSCNSSKENGHETPHSVDLLE